MATLPTPALLPGKSHGQRSLVGYSPWVHTELDMIERPRAHSNNIIFRCTEKPQKKNTSKLTLLHEANTRTEPTASPRCAFICLCKLSCVETQLHPCMHILSLATFMLSTYNTDHYGPESLKYLLILCSPLQKQLFEPWSVRCIREGRN